MNSKNELSSFFLSFVCFLVFTSSFVKLSYFSLLFCCFSSLLFASKLNSRTKSDSIGESKLEHSFVVRVSANFHLQATNKLQANTKSFPNSACSLPTFVFRAASPLRMRTTPTFPAQLKSRSRKLKRAQMRGFLRCVACAKHNSAFRVGLCAKKVSTKLAINKTLLNLKTQSSQLGAQKPMQILASGNFSLLINIISFSGPFLSLFFHRNSYKQRNASRRRFVLQKLQFLFAKTTQNQLKTRLKFNKTCKHFLHLQFLCFFSKTKLKIEKKKPLNANKTEFVI